MNVLIIEDEVPAYRRLEKIISDIDPKINIMEVLDSVEDSVKWLSNHRPPDLIFMDIQISDGSSFEIFEQIDVISPVIFTTAYEEYTLRAFKVHSIDYLLKPIKKEELEQALNKFKSIVSQAPTSNDEMLSLLKGLSLSRRAYKSRFLVKLGDKMLAVRTEDIAYFVSKRGVVRLITRRKQSYATDFTLEELSNVLDPWLFFRANRQFLINVEFIIEVQKYFKGKLIVKLEPRSDEQIVVSSEKATAFKNWIDR